MEMELELTGEDANETTLLAFQDWIKREQVEGLQARRKSGKPEKDEMGFDSGTILSVVLGSAAVVELVRSLHVWMKMRKPKVRMKLKTKDKEVEVDAENLPDEKAFIDFVLRTLNL